MGRDAENDDLKMARGTLRADRSRKVVEMAPLKKTVRVPDGLLTRRAKFEYSRVMRALSGEGLAAEVDKSLLIAYCNEMAAYFINAKEAAEAEEIAAGMQVTAETLAKYKAILMQIAAQERKRDTALKNAIKLAEMFGLTPSARGKIKTPKQKKSEDPTESAFQKLLSA